MDDIDLQFDIEIPFEQDKKTKKPFPGDFSFNADGRLEDCEVEDLLMKPEQAEQGEIPADVPEDYATPFWEEFEDVVEEDVEEDDASFLDEFSNDIETVAPVEKPEDNAVDTEDDEDEDDESLWEEFRDVFEEEDVPAEAIPEEDTVIETDTDETDDAETEDILAETEDDEDDAILWEEFRDVFEEKEEPVEPVLVGALVEDSHEDEEPGTIEETEEIIAEKEVPMEDIDADEADDEEPVEEDDADDEDFEFPEDPDAECDFVAVPKPTVTVTTWDQVRQRANASKKQKTYETDSFFAVEEDYTEQKEPKTPKPAEQVMGISVETKKADDEETEPIQPIWYVDDMDHPEELNTEVTDEDMDYDDIFNDDRTSYRKKKKRKNLLRKILKEIGLFLLIIVGALVLVINFTIFFSRQNTVVGHSMEPTLHGGDHVYTTMLPYIFGEPEVGDIIVFDYSCHGEEMNYFHRVGEVLKNNRLTQIFKDDGELQLDEYWIKRVVAVAGDTVSFKDNQFYRNGELVEEDYILEQTVTDYENGKVYVVPEGQVFVMGDNRNNSTDSRIIGCIDIDIITGKVWKKG